MNVMNMPDSVAELGITLYAEPAWNCVTLSTEGSRGSTWRDTTPSKGRGGGERGDTRYKREKGFNVRTITCPN